MTILESLVVIGFTAMIYNLHRAIMIVIEYQKLILEKLTGKRPK